MLQNHLILFIYFLSIGITKAQTLDSLSLQDAYQYLEDQYPILQNEGLLEEILAHDLKNLERSRLPEITINNETRLQSQSVSLDNSDGTLPLDIDQPLISVKSFVEANYQVVDGGRNKAQQKLRTAQHQVSMQELKIQKHQLKDRINQLFLQIQLQREQLQLLQFSRANLEARLSVLQAGLEMGITLQSEVQLLEVRILELEQSQVLYQNNITAFLDQLAFLTGQSLAKNIQLYFPVLPAPKAVPAISRPELRLFQYQKSAVLAQADLFDSNRKPKLNAFAQLGGGYPNPLNLLDNGVAPFATIGTSFRWQITDWKKTKTDKQLLSLQALQIDHQEESFQFDIESQSSTYLQTVERLETQLQQDQKIANLQANILEQMAAQLEEGIITSSDYLLQVNAELAARQTLVIRQIELKKAQIDMLNLRGYL
ncbi:MAG: TolC family protein [Bacteroidota bacterium]